MCNNRIHETHVHLFGISSCHLPWVVFVKLSNMSWFSRAHEGPFVSNLPLFCLCQKQQTKSCIKDKIVWLNGQTKQKKLTISYGDLCNRFSAFRCSNWVNIPHWQTDREYVWDKKPTFSFFIQFLLLSSITTNWNGVKCYLKVSPHYPD